MQLLTGTARLVLDLSEVDYVDSRGLGILVGLFVSSVRRGGELKLVGPTHRVQEALRRTHLNTILTVYASKEDALSAFRAQAMVAGRAQTP